MIAVTHTIVRKASHLVKPSGYKGFVPDLVTIYVTLRNLKDSWSNDERGYDGEEVQLQINKATSYQRQELLHPKIKTTEQITPLVATYHPDLPHLSRILHNHQGIIDISSRLKEVVPRLPCCLSLPP